MTDDPAPYSVGYKRPPEHGQFRKGQSGNPAGRPRTRGAVKIDFGEVADGAVTVIQDGVTRRMQPKEVALRRILKKALRGDLPSIIYLVEQFEKYGAIEWPKPAIASSVIVLPKSMPSDMSRKMLLVYGLPPWTPRQVSIARAAHLASRSEGQRLEDEAMDYPDLKVPK